MNVDVTVMTMMYHSVVKFLSSRGTSKLTTDWPKPSACSSMKHCLRSGKQLTHLLQDTQSDSTSAVASNAAWFQLRTDIASIQWHLLELMTVTRKGLPRETAELLQFAAADC